MEFFDKKSEVIDIKLTKLGKQLYADGKFKPAYYFFSDDDILYDSGFMSGSGDPEEQNAIVPRIEEQPHFKVVPSRTEMAILGSSDPNRAYAPAWSVNVLQGQIESVKRGSEDAYRNITDLLTATRIDMLPATCSFDASGHLNVDGYVFEIEEKNVEYSDLEVEFSMYVESPLLSSNKDKTGQFVPLMFANMARSEVVDGVLVEYPFEPVNFTEENVERYLDITFDDVAGTKKPLIVSLSEKQISKAAEAAKTYKTNITNNDIEEKC